MKRSLMGVLGKIFLTPKREHQNGLFSPVELLQLSQYWYEEEVSTGSKAKLENHKEMRPSIPSDLIITNLLDFLNYAIQYIS